MQKTVSATNKEVLVLRFFSVIQTESNEFMRTWNCRNKRKRFETSGRIPEMLFNLLAVAGFPKNGVDVTAIDIKVAKEIICIDLYLTCKI